MDFKPYLGTTGVPHGNDSADMYKYYLAVRQSELRGYHMAVRIHSGSAMFVCVHDKSGKIVYTEMGTFGEVAEGILYWFKHYCPMEAIEPNIVLGYN